MTQAKDKPNKPPFLIAFEDASLEELEHLSRIIKSNLETGEIPVIAGKVRVFPLWDQTDDSLDGGIKAAGFLVLITWLLVGIKFLFS